MDLPVKVQSYDTTGSAWKASQRNIVQPLDKLTYPITVMDLDLQPLDKLTYPITVMDLDLHIR